MLYNHLPPEEKKKYKRLAAEFERLDDTSRDFLERYTSLLAELYVKTGGTPPRGEKNGGRGEEVFPVR
jgi:hypothetical protein